MELEDLAAWSEHVDSVIVSEPQVDELILQYFIFMGLEDPARAFLDETGRSLDLAHFHMAERKAIRSAVLEGHVMDSFSLLDSVSPRLLQEHPALEFRLWVLRVVELVRASDTSGALSVIGKQLAPLSVASPSFAPDVETLALLVCFGPGSPAAAPASAFLTVEYAEATADAVNAIILRAVGLSPHAALVDVLSSCVHLQRVLG